MSTLKEDWEIVGKELGATLEDMGKAILKTAQTGAKKLNDFLNSEETDQQTK